MNAITGIKPANLVGTQNENGQSNLAIFSSVVHLGSNPPLIGMITRPVAEVPRHTYQNILKTGYYTINSVPVNKTENAHYTSAKFEKGESEFESCGFQEEYLANFAAPFVKESAIKIGLKLVEEIPIEINQTLMLIGEVQHLFIKEAFIGEEGYLDLANMEVAGVSGLNSYYRFEKLGEYPYARTEDWKK